MTDVTEDLSILFADLLGSVRLYERLQKAEAQLMVERYLKRIQHVIEGFSGQVVGTEGDELMAVFSKPDSACQAAIEMQKRIGDLPPSSAVKLAMRVGLSYGSVKKSESGYSGEAINIAACMASIAKPGQILACQLSVAALPPPLKAMAKQTREVLVNRSSQKTTAFELLIPRLSYRPSTEKPLYTYTMSEDGEIKTKFLRLHYLDKSVVLNKTKKEIKIGRSPGNDVLIQTPLASRNHAHVERSDRGVVLVDHSQNGTYITREGEPEVFIRKDRFTLYGRGVISFGTPIRTQIADFAEFDFCEEAGDEGNR